DRGSLGQGSLGQRSLGQGTGRLVGGIGCLPVAGRVQGLGCRSSNNDLEALRFRLAESRDVGAIVGLVDSAYRGDASRAGWTTEADLLDGQRTDTEAVSAVVDARGSAMLVAEADGQLAGCCQLERRPGGEVYFGMFAVRPGLQGQGRGQEILTEAE